MSIGPEARDFIGIEIAKIWRVFPTGSVVEGAGRNLIDDARKADKRDDGKDADPIGEAPWAPPSLLRGTFAAERSLGLPQPAFRPINVPRQAVNRAPQCFTRAVP